VQLEQIGLCTLPAGLDAYSAARAVKQRWSPRQILEHLAQNEDTSAALPDPTSGPSSKIYFLITANWLLRGAREVPFSALFGERCSKTQDRKGDKRHLRDRDRHLECFMENNGGLSASPPSQYRIGSTASRRRLS